MILNDVKMALRVTTTAYDSELSSLITAAREDLGIAGVNNSRLSTTDSIVLQAVVTYCKMNFGSGVPDYDRLKASYDEQKAQLSMATGYTDWGDE